jgi:hypothetical protein
MRRVLVLSLALVVPALPLGAQSFDIVKVTEGVWAAIPKAGVPVGSNGAFVVNDDTCWWSTRTIARRTRAS